MLTIKKLSFLKIDIVQCFPSLQHFKMQKLKTNKIKNKTKKNLKELRSLVHNIIRTSKDFYKLRPRLFLLFASANIFVSFLPFLGAYINARLIDNLIKAVSGELTDHQVIFSLLALALGVFFITEMFWKIVDYLDKMTFQRWHVHASYTVHKATAGLDVEMYESNKNNKFLNKITNGYAWQPAEFVTLTFSAFQELIEMISAAIIMILLAPILIPILLISLLPEFKINLSAAKSSWGIWDLKGDERIRFFSTTLYLSDEKYIKESRIFKSTQHLLNTLKKAIAEFIEAQNKVISKEFKNSSLARIFNFTIKGGIQVWLILKVINDILFSIGDYTFYLSTIQRFSESSRKLLKTLSRLYERNLYMKAYYKLLDMEPKIKSEENATVISTAKIPTIEFKNVSFSYPGSTEKIFDNFSIKIEPGEDIALVGENGAGKTTFVKLLARLYDVNKGQILINGTDLRKVNLESWYENLGILFQDFNKYSYSVEENIALGRITDFNNTKKIIDASKNSGAHEFVKDYDLKYKKMLSKEYKGGIELSGGQWQKIALARAFFRNSNILILDEPTSAIDAKAEYEIFKRVSEMQKEKTTIIISHRFSTVKKAKNIYVIKKGAIVEKGSHKDLMKIKNGQYKEMFELQANEYRD